MEYITPIAVIMSGMIGSSVAVWAILTQRTLARKKNSHDIIMHAKSDSSLDESLRIIGKINADKDLDIVDYAEDEKHHSADSIKIRYVLNFYESLAVGLYNGIYEQETIRDNWETRICRVWKATEAYAGRRRTLGHQPKAYEFFEKMAKGWEKKPTPPK